MILDSFRGYNVRQCLIGSIILIAALLPLSAHEIPADVTVYALVQPAGHTLRLLVRTPLRAMRDVDFPETAQGYLDIERLSPQLPDIAKVWISDFIRIHEDGRLLPRPTAAAAQIALESDRSFALFATALDHVRGPKLSSAANIPWSQALFDVLFEYPIDSPASRFSIDPALGHLAARVVTVVRYAPLNGPERAYEFQGNPGVVPLDPGWLDAAARFVRLGFFHILDGTDHLLFLFCLVIPLRRFRPLLAVVTAFTAAHSITLLASAYGLAPDALWFPPLIETLIAASIVWMALENIVSPNVRRRWMIAFGFGLVHGFGFSFALRETLQFAGSHLLLSLLSFNAGVELGQLLVLALMIPLLQLTFRFVVAERTGSIVISALVAHTAWHWMIDRAEVLRRYRFEWPWLGIPQLAFAAKWLTLAWLAAGVAWMLMRHGGRAFFRPHPLHQEYDHPAPETSQGQIAKHVDV